MQFLNFICRQHDCKSPYLVLILSSMTTQEKVRKLEREVAKLWQILDDDRLWDPSLTRELLRRSQTTRKAYGRGSLRPAERVLASLVRR